LGSRLGKERLDADILQTKSVETTVAAIQDDNDSSLPPLMNPSILEASDDLTNLSHLNEPAGMFGSAYLCEDGCLRVIQQFYKRSSFAMHKKKSIHTLA